MITALLIGAGALWLICRRRRYPTGLLYLTHLIIDYDTKDDNGRVLYKMYSSDGSVSGGYIETGNTLDRIIRDAFSDGCVVSVIENGVPTNYNSKEEYYGKSSKD